MLPNVNICLECCKLLYLVFKNLIEEGSNCRASRPLPLVRPDIIWCYEKEHVDLPI